MDERAAIPVSLPPKNPTISYWQDPPDRELMDYFSKGRVPERADTVIIGSGITGSSIAWNLLQNHCKYPPIVMLEARQACSGATGRNGGHTKAASYRSFLSNAKQLGTLEAIKIAKLEYANILAVHEFAREHEIDCDSWQGDTVDIIYDQAQWDEARTAIEAMRRAMPTEEDLETVSRYRLWSADLARTRWGVRGEMCKGAVSYPAGSLSAYKFVIGLLKLCLPLGLQFFTHTPATSISIAADGYWRVETFVGTVKADRVVLATNGYTAHLWSGFQGSIVPLRGQITAHRPGTKMRGIQELGRTGTYSFIYENGYEYMIPRPPGSKFEGDIIIGGGLVKAKDEGLYEFGTTDDTTKNEEISKYLTETTPKYFGWQWGYDHPEGRIRKEWTGIMGYSSDGFPFVGEVPGQKDLWIAASFQGHGMVLCWMSAKALVSMIQEREYEMKYWFPEAFKVTEERMKKRFKGRLHTKAEPNSKLNSMEIESKARKGA